MVDGETVKIVYSAGDAHQLNPLLTPATLRALVRSGRLRPMGKAGTALIYSRRDLLEAARHLEETRDAGTLRAHIAKSLRRLERLEAEAEATRLTIAELRRLERRATGEPAGGRLIEFAP